MKNIFSNYKSQAIKKCLSMSYKEKVSGLWANPEIYHYFDSFTLDDANTYLSSLVTRNKTCRKILIIGGGIGRLGRNIARKKHIQITEIDLSMNMSNHANKLAKDGKLNNFISMQGDCLNLPFADNAFDCVIAYGVFRYLDVKDYPKAIAEIERVSRKVFIFSEPVLSKIISSIRKKISHDILTKIEKIPIQMYRMSLFYMLFSQYQKDTTFKKLVDSKIKGDKTYIDILSQIAGTKKGILYTLICKKP